MPVIYVITPGWFSSMLWGIRREIKAQCHEIDFGQPTVQLAAIPNAEISFYSSFVDNSRFACSFRRYFQAHKKERRKHISWVHTALTCFS